MDFLKSNILKKNIRKNKGKHKKGRKEGGKKGTKAAQTSTEREREEPWGEGRQEKAGSTAPGCSGSRSGEVGDDSNFGIPYI